MLLGLLYAGCQVKSCMEAKQELKEYHRADQIRKEDPKIDKHIQLQLQKEFLKLYWAWQGDRDKMEMRAGYK